MTTETNWKTELTNVELYKSMPSWVYGFVCLWLSYMVYAAFQAPMSMLITVAVVSGSIFIGFLVKSFIVRFLNRNT